MDDIKIGDYVLATRWSDEDPNDPWAVGFVAGIHADWGVMLHGADKKPLPGVGARWFRYWRRVSQEEGEKIVREWPAMEAARFPSLIRSTLPYPNDRATYGVTTIGPPT